MNAEEIMTIIRAEIAMIAGRYSYHTTEANFHNWIKKHWLKTARAHTSV